MRSSRRHRSPSLFQALLSDAADHVSLGDASEMKSLTQLAAASMEPVDAEFFLWCSGIYSAAAHLSTPVENPASRPIFADGDKHYAFSDIPLNRGMLAVMNELRERGSSEDEKMAMCSRLMHFGEVFGAHEELGAVLKKGR